MTARWMVWLLAVVVCCGLVSPAEAQVKVDPKLPAYKAVGGVSGNLKSVGSDTMLKEMTDWVLGFKKFYPSVNEEIEGKGSSTGPPALIAGTAQFAPMSRPMKAKEIDDFKKAYGYEPTALRTSIDMLAVYVHKDNPLKGLTLQQVDAIFSQTRKAGYKNAVKTWGDLGLVGEWKDRPIALYGRNAASGTYGFFKEHVLANGDFRNDVKEQPGSSAVVQSVAGDKFAIGYSGIGYKTADVRAVPLARGDKGNFVTAEPEHAYNGTYPLARFLFVYINYKPNSQLEPLRREFLRYIFSREGQQEVIGAGYLPVNHAVATKELNSINVK